MTVSEQIRLIQADVFDGIQRAYYEVGSEVTPAQYYAARWALDCWQGRVLSLLDYPCWLAEVRRYNILPPAKRVGKS